MTIPHRAAAARAVSGGLAALTAVEIAGAVALGAAAGLAGVALAPLAVALGVAGAIRAAAGALTIGRQRILERAARADTEPERFAPSPRVIVTAERAPLVIASITLALAPALALVLEAIAWVEGAPPGDARSVLLVAAVSAIGIAPAAALAGAPLERWIARLPARDLPDRPARAVAVESVALAVAPMIGVALVAVAVAPSGWARLAVAALSLATAALVGAREASRSLAARRELDALAARIELVEIASPPPERPLPLRSHAALGAWAAARTEIDRASVELRSEADAQRQIEQEEAVRTRFMAAMGHELRSPLNSIVGFAQLLEEGADGPLAPGQRESVTMIRRSAEELLRLLTDILDSARLDAGRLRLKRAWTPSVEIVTEAVRLGRSVVEGHAVSIEAQVQPGLPPVYVDRARIVQAVVATFRHAARGMSSGTLALRATTGRAPGGVASLLVEVRDEARKLSTDELARVFDAFAELRDASSGRRIGGLGLALSLARKLVRLHGGEVWAESRASEGTRYVVAVPLAPLADADTTAARAAIAGGLI